MRRVWFVLFLLAGCSKGPEADLQYVSKARSLAAEWALVNEQAARGRLTETYIRAMREALRSQIRTTQSALTTPGSAYDREMKALLAEPADASPDALRVHVHKLKAIEDSLESA